MIDYAKVKVGDRLKIVGAGAPGFAKVGDVVTVTSCNGRDRLDVSNGERAAYFALTCGAARLEPFDHICNPVTSAGDSDACSRTANPAD